MYKIHFCLILKLNGIIFNKAIEHLKIILRVVDNALSDKHVEGFDKYKSKPQKVQPHSTNLIFHDLESFNTNRCVPYSVGL